jgi:hypothetical protein
MKDKTRSVDISGQLNANKRNGRREPAISNEIEHEANIVKGARLNSVFF